MFRYYFIFLIWFFLVIYILTKGYSLIDEAVTNIVIKNNAINLRNAFTNLIWRKYDFMLERYIYDIKKWQSTSQFLRFERETKMFFEHLNVTQVRVLSKGNELIFQLNRDRPEDYDHTQYIGLNNDNSNFSQTNIITYLYSNKEMAVALPIFTKVEDREAFDAIIEITYNIDKILHPIKQTWNTFIIWLSLLLLSFISWIVYRFHVGAKLLNEQYDINTKLKLAKKTVEEESVQKSQFLANVSHELKTPLNAIIGFAEVIKGAEDSKVSYQYKEYAGDIYNSGGHLLNLINDILDYSKSEVNKLKLEESWFDLVAIIETCIRMVTANQSICSNENNDKDTKDSKDAIISNIIINKNFFEKEIFLNSDRKRFKQVILNILSNAIKFRKEGKQECKINISVKLLDKEIIIEIADNGIGIAEEDLAKVMTIFGQASNSLARQYEGTGIGLPISKRLVQLMGGIFSISSQKDQGTTVTITLPYETEFPQK